MHETLLGDPIDTDGKYRPIESITAALNWFLAPENRLIMWIAIGVKLFATFSKLAYNKDFPVDTREANLLALGFQQITNSQNYWNDPTASLSSPNRLAKLRDMWGLNSPDDVCENVERLLTQRRQREFSQQLPALVPRGAL